MRQFRDEHARVAAEAENANRLLQRLGKAKQHLEPREQEDAAKQQAATQAAASLSEFHQPLGKAAFEAWLGSAIAEHPAFAERRAVYQKIAECRQQCEQLTPADDAKTLDKAKAKTKQLAIAGKIKLEEAKVRKLERQIGQQLIDGGQEGAARCEATAKILEQIAGRRTEVADKQQQAEQAAAALASTKQKLAEKLTLPPIENTASLNAQITQCNKQIAQSQKQRATLERGLPDQLTADASLAADTPFGAQVQMLRELQSQLQATRPSPAALISRAKSLSTPMKLAIGVLLLVCGGLAMFGGGNGGTGGGEDVTDNNGGPTGRRAGPGPELSADSRSAQNVKAVFAGLEKMQQEFNKLGAKNPRVRIIGEIRDRAGPVLNIWGRAIPTNGDFSSEGALLEEANITVLDANTSVIRANYYAGGYHYFVSRGSGKNAFGAQVPVYNYGGPPPELKATADELEALEKEYHVARRNAVADALQKSAKPEGRQSDTLARLKKTIGGLSGLNSYRGIQVGDSRDVVDALAQKRVIASIGGRSGAYVHVFPDDGVVINTSANEVQAITYALQASTLAEYFSFTQEFELTQSAQSNLVLDAPLLSEHFQELGWRGVGPIWNSRTAELVEVNVQAADGSGEKNQYRFVCLSADQRLYALAVTVHNNAVVQFGTSAMPFDTSNTDHDPLLDRRFQRSARLAQATDPLPAVDYRQLRREWKRHDKAVLDIALSPSGRRAVSGGEDGKVVLWHTGGGTALHAFEGHRGAVTAVAYAKGDRVLSGGADGQLRIWNAATKQSLHELPAHESGVLDVAVSADGRRAITGGKDRKIHVWDLEAGKKLKSLPGQSDWVAAVAFSPDGKSALSGCRDGVVTVWDVDAGTASYKFEEHKAGVRHVAFTADGKQALSGGDDHVMYLWDSDSGKIVRRFIGSHDVSRGRPRPDETNLTALSVSGGLRAVTGHQSGVVFSWNLDYPRQEQFASFGSHDYENRRGITSVACSPDGRRMLVAYGDAEIVSQILPPPTAAGETPVGLLATFGDGQQEGIQEFALSSDNQRLAIHQTNNSDREDELLLYQVDSGEELVRANLGKDVHRVVFSPDLRWAAVTFTSLSRKHHGEIWDVAAGKVHRRQLSTGVNQGYTKVSSFAFSPDGQNVTYLDVDRRDGLTREYAVVTSETESGKELRRIDLNQPGDLKQSFRSVDYSPDLKWLVLNIHDKSHLVDAESNVMVASSSRPGMFSPDSRRYLYPDKERQLKIVDLTTRKSSVFEGLPVGMLEAVRLEFGRDGSRLAAGGSENQIDVYDLTTGRKTRSVPGAGYGIYRFLPGGKRIISGSSSGQIVIADIDSEQAIHKFEGPPTRDAIERLSVSTDGRLAVTGDNTGEVNVWGLPK